MSFASNIFAPARHYQRLVNLYRQRFEHYGHGTVVSAGVSMPSSSRLLADRLAQATIADLSESGVRTELTNVELRDHAMDITRNLIQGFASPSLEDAIETVTSADGATRSDVVTRRGNLVHREELKPERLDLTKHAVQRSLVGHPARQHGDPVVRFPAQRRECTQERLPQYPSHANLIERRGAGLIHAPSLSPGRVTAHRTDRVTRDSVAT